MGVLLMTISTSVPFVNFCPFGPCLYMAQLPHRLISPSLIDDYQRLQFQHPGHPHLGYSATHRFSDEYTRVFDCYD